MGNVLLSATARSGRREAEDARGDDVLLDLRRATHDALGAAVEVDLQRDVVTVERGLRARDRERGAADRLLDPRHQELVDRSARPVLDTVEPPGAGGGQGEP